MLVDNAPYTLLKMSPMIIQLNVLQNGSSAQIYAYAEDHEESSPTFYNTRVVKIWHNKNTRSMQVFVARPKNCDNDYFVLFKSRVPFREFCEQFHASEYNDSSQYHFFKHNCANAANHALKLAKIDLDITNSIHLSRMYPNSIIKIPSPILTPSDIYHLAKNHKIKEFSDEKQQVNSIYFKIELASTRLCLWAKKADDRVKNNIATILSEIDSSMQARTHHAEFYLKALIDTIDILMHLTSKNDIEDYQNLSSYLKERELSQSLQKYDQQFKLSAFLFLLYCMEILTGIQQDWRLTCLAYIVITITTYRFLKSLCQEGDDYTPTIKNDTQLSQAMSDLAACVEEKTPFTCKS